MMLELSLDLFESCRMNQVFGVQYIVFYLYMPTYQFIKQLNSKYKIPSRKDLKVTYHGGRQNIIQAQK